MAFGVFKRSRHSFAAFKIISRYYGLHISRVSICVHRLALLAQKDIKGGVAILVDLVLKRPGSSISSISQGYKFKNSTKTTRTFYFDSTSIPPGGLLWKFKPVFEYAEVSHSPKLSPFKLRIHAIDIQDTKLYEEFLEKYPDVGQLVIGLLISNKYRIAASMGLGLIAIKYLLPPGTSNAYLGSSPRDEFKEPMDKYKSHLKTDEGCSPEEQKELGLPKFVTGPNFSFYYSVCVDWERAGQICCPSWDSVTQKCPFKD